MVYKCKNCGAKLEIDKTTEFIKCAYCDSVNKIESNKLIGDISDLKSKSKIGCVAITVFGLVLIGIGLTIYLLNRPEKSTDNTDSQTNTIVKKDLPYTYYLDNGFLIDFNGDKYIDIATIAINTDEKGAYYLQILDGKTGRILKQTKTDKEKNADLYVFDKKYIFVAKDDFTFTLHDLKNLSVNKTFALTDKINYFKLTGDTLHIRTFDEINWAIDLKNQALSKEDYHFDRSERLVDHYYLSEIREGDYVYKAVMKEKSSKDLFSVIAEKDGQVLWNLPLGYEDVTFGIGGPVLVVSEQMVVTFGKRFDTPHFGCLIGIDKTEGRVKYEKEITGETCYLNDFYYNGQYAIANIYGTLYAFDPNTGETVWMAGRKCELQ